MFIKYSCKCQFKAACSIPFFRGRVANQHQPPFIRKTRITTKKLINNNNECQMLSAFCCFYSGYILSVCWGYRGPSFLCHTSLKVAAQMGAGVRSHMNNNRFIANNTENAFKWNEMYSVWFYFRYPGSVFLKGILNLSLLTVFIYIIGIITWFL